MKGAILVCGTHSDAGKSVVAAGICRWLHRQGVSVAPFKAQNMALNSVVTLDGGEIGRAQAMQAAAAGVEPEAAMNPVLLKPTGERRSQVMAMGEVRGEVGARDYQGLKGELAPLVAGALADLRERFDVLVCEGAGSPAEINLRDGDLANMGLARAASLPVLVVSDIDRGGAFASMLGTLALLDTADQAHLAGFVINKFRGDEALLEPAIATLTEATGRPTLGVLPWLEGIAFEAEDSLALQGPAAEPEAGENALDVAVVRLRWISNFTDFDALAAEPGVRLRYTRSAADIERADLVVLPGTKATVRDLEELRADGLDRALARRAEAGQPLLGICGGHQMLGERIVDRVESGEGESAGLSLLPVVTEFEEEKLLRRRQGRSEWLGADAAGYEIRHGRVARHGGEPLFTADDGEDEGCRVGSVLGTSWHGLLEGDELRRSLLTWVAERRDRGFEPGTRPFAAVREARLDALGDLVADHLDTERLQDLIENGPPAELPSLRTEMSACFAS
ncbi:MAG TPA: cobyric acid synthase [Solirubrobacterales bacterium]|nr:cobyric acid synthase [Solirubrobacterales bacterium]